MARISGDYRDYRLRIATIARASRLSLAHRDYRSHIATIARTSRLSLVHRNYYFDQLFGTLLIRIFCFYNLICLLIHSVAKTFV